MARVGAACPPWPSQRDLWCREAQRKPWGHRHSKLGPGYPELRSPPELPGHLRRGWAIAGAVGRLEQPEGGGSGARFRYVPCWRCLFPEGPREAWRRVMASARRPGTGSGLTGPGQGLEGHRAVQGIALRGWPLWASTPVRQLLPDNPPLRHGPTCSQPGLPHGHSSSACPPAWVEGTALAEA